MRAVHPRACGERGKIELIRATDIGSSPRVRGTDQARAGVGEDGRFIPARAGNGDHTILQKKVDAVHPRACGERMSCHISATPSNGSSPRVRGTVKEVLKAVGVTRFIPARAGNGDHRASMRLGSAVHPRACGERLCVLNSAMWRFGSSPRVRGTDFLCLTVFKELSGTRKFYREIS